MNNQDRPLTDEIIHLSDSSVGITSSPSTTLEIEIDIREQSKTERALGQMVHVVLEEDGNKILVIGQIVEVSTKNRWHEDQSFKGVIKRYGSLPHLSGVADNRLATLSVQSSYDLSSQVPQSHILGISPSTGIDVHKMNNAVMAKLIEHQKDSVTYIGRIYGTEVDLPMWFKHFGKDDEENKEYGAGDAYHIGVFGKTGSGKTVTAAMALLGYAKNKSNMSILVFDPQRQFTQDQELLPDGEKLQEHIENMGMKVQCFKLIEGITLSDNRVDVFSDLLVGSGFIADAFAPFYQEEKISAMKNSIAEYIEGRSNKSSFHIGEEVPRKLLKEMMERFLKLGSKSTSEKPVFSQYITDVYGTKDTQKRLYDSIRKQLKKLEGQSDEDFEKDATFRKWLKICRLFQPGDGKITINNLAKQIVEDKGNFIILDLTPAEGDIENENLQAIFLRLIEEKIVEKGSLLYSKGEKANCLIVLDEAHRFAGDVPDMRIKELARSIVDSVRTVRKYGIGHMFITQSIESIDDEILKQMRIFAFGHGLTTGSELRKVREIVNSDPAIKLYRSFIDPSASKRYPFMFFGPVSPLSATGAPLFLETYTNISDLNRKITSIPTKAG